jgi:hypothetical protein
VTTKKVFKKIKMKIPKSDLARSDQQPPHKLAISKQNSSTLANQNMYINIYVESINKI